MISSYISFVIMFNCSLALIALGALDKVVIHEFRFFKQLQRRGVDCDLKMFPLDSHSLSSVGAQSDSFLLAHRWFQKLAAAAKI